MKDPAFLFYSDNFLSGTMFFTDEQVGKYIRLLCAQHLTGHLKENHMIFLCKSHDSDIWSKFTKDNDGLFYNDRLETEILRRQKYSESRSNNKKGKGKIIKNKSKIISKSYDSHMGNGNGNGNIKENNDNYLLLFDKFRSKYQGTKRGNETEFEYFKKCHDDWKNILPKLERYLDFQITQRKKLKEKNLFVPEWKNLKTYIYNRSWEETKVIEESTQAYKSLEPAI